MGTISAILMATAIWVKGAEKELNSFYGFTAEFDYRGGEAVMRMSAGSIAKTWVNGKMVGYGPARAPEGFARVDEMNITPYLKAGRNIIAIEACNSHINQFYLMEKDAFLYAEVKVDGKVVAETGRNFKARPLPERVKKINRFSYMRGFAEFLKVTPKSDDWRLAGIADAGLELAEQPLPKLLEREMTYPDFHFDGTFAPTFKTKNVKNPKKKGRSERPLDGCGKGPFKGFKTEELEMNLKLRTEQFEAVEKCAAGRMPVTLGDMEGVVFDNAHGNAGFVHMEVECKKPTILWVLMDESVREDGLPDAFASGNMIDVCGWRLLEPGSYTLECFEPNEVGAAHIICEGGEATITRFDLRTYINSETCRAKLKSSDATLNAVFEAAKNTLAVNAVDAFTDCAGRERGVYFGDTVFTGRGADVLLGDNSMERVCFMNFALAAKFHDVPDGMIPMCYPGDVVIKTAHWIPNFGLWSVIQLEGYLRRSGDQATVDAYRKRAEGILGWFRKARNAEGVLEKMPGWIFVEWSDAAKYVQDVSYVSNMIYVRFLDTMARLYGMQDCAVEAEALRAKIRQQSLSGIWYCDNAKRGKDGALRRTDNRTELCQYAAFMSGVATREKDPDLYRIMVDEMGPLRDRAKVHPEIHPSDMLFGYTLRFVLLDQWGYGDKVLNEVRGCYGPQACGSGTLWEGFNGKKSGYSQAHGFPSIAAWLIARNALGLKGIDRNAKVVTLDETKTKALEWFECTLPISREDNLVLRKQAGKFEAILPMGWKRQ